MAQIPAPDPSWPVCSLRSPARLTERLLKPTGEGAGSKHSPLWSPGPTMLAPREEPPSQRAMRRIDVSGSCFSHGCVEGGGGSIPLSRCGMYGWLDGWQGCAGCAGWVASSASIAAKF